MLETRHLKTLIALRDTGSLVEAADRVFLTQSALSHQLKELESRLGAELFARKTKPLRFTEVGKRLLALADEILPKIDATEQDIKKMVQGNAGRLFMAIECHSCFNWLMPTVEDFRDLWPAVELDFLSGFTFDPLSALEQGEVDLVITSDPVDLKGIHYLPLFTYELQIALASHHALAQKKYLSPQDFSDQTLITYPVEKERLDIFKRFLTPANIEPANIRRVELTLMIIQLVSSGRGLSALPNWALAEYVEQEFIEVRSAGESGIWPTLYAAVREETVEQSFLKDFIEMAIQHCMKNLRGVKAVVVENSI